MLKNQMRLVTKKDPLLASLDARNVGIREFRIIKDILYPKVQKDETLLMAIDYCQSRKLDIMKKPIQIVSIYDSETKLHKDTIWTSIAEIRITATRTGKYAGRTEAEFGEEVTENLGGARITYPKWCKITVFRLVENQKCSFSAKIFWKETYKTVKYDSPIPNSMWVKRAYGQLEKCCEAAALRSAFPEEFGNDYIAEEAFDVNEGLANVTSKSKTASAHTLSSVIEENFTLPNKQYTADKIPGGNDLILDSEGRSVQGFYEDENQKAETLYSRISKGLSSLTSVGGIKRYMENEAENMAYLKENASELFDIIQVIEKRKLGVVQLPLKEVIDEAGDLLPQADEKSEEIYNRVTKNLDFLMNKKAVEAYTSGMAEELKYLAQTRADYHAHVISLIKDKLAKY